MERSKPEAARAVGQRERVIEGRHGSEERESDSQSRWLLASVIAAMGADSGSVFVLDDDGVSLHGASGVWDWTRTSFRVRLDLWPTVQHAVESNEAVRITRANASEYELDWFEPGGIDSCVCAPMVAGERTLGVLFMDFVHPSPLPSDEEVEETRAIATRWAETMLTRSSSHPHPEIRLAKASPRTVKDLLSSAPVCLDCRVTAEAATRIASMSGASFLLAVKDGELQGIVRRSALDQAHPSTPVAELMIRTFPSIEASTSPSEAARVLLDTGAGCVPVLSDDNELLGLLTRRELREAGFLPGELGFDVCAACGGTQDLGPYGTDAVVFCTACLSAPSTGSLQELYGTLGGSD